MKTQFSPAPLATARATGVPARRWWAPLNPPLTSWKGRRIWIIGASSGIGRATAEALLRQGAHLIVSARNEAALQDFSSRQAGQNAATGATIRFRPTRWKLFGE